MSASKHGRLRLTIISAMGLDPNASPFVVLKTGDFKLAETEYKRHCGEPHWNKSYLVKLNDVATDELIFEVYSYHFLSRTEKIGVARLTNLESLERQIVKQHELPLQGTSSLGVLNIFVFPEDFGVGDEQILHKWHKISENDQHAIDNMLSLIIKQCPDLGREIDKKVLNDVLHEHGDLLLGNHLYDTINTLDVDHDGKITHNEFREYFAGICLEAYKQMRKAKNELIQSIKQSDKNKDGFIDKDEFHEFYKGLMARDKSVEPVSKDDLARLLQQCDLNGDGRVSIQELVTAFAPEVDSFLENQNLE